MLVITSSLLIFVMNTDSSSQVLYFRELSGSDVLDRKAGHSICPLDQDSCVDD